MLLSLGGHSYEIVKTQLQAKAIAAAINLVRIRQMLQRTQLGLSPRPKRPLSPFARLRSLLAA